MDSRAPAPPAAPQPAAPPPGLVVARWTYVDEARTHEVHAGVRPGAPSAFVIKESAFQNERADELVEQTITMEAPWEAQLFQWQLECRLAALGRYWRHDARDPGWRALVPPQGRIEPDVREAPSLHRGRVRFFHFHRRASKEDRVLVAIPGARTLLARAAFSFPDAAEGDLALLHAHLPEGPARSLLVREHMALRTEGFEKLVVASEFQRAHGADWERELASVQEQLLERIAEGRWGAPAKPRSIAIDPVYTDFVKALTDPRLLDLQARFLSVDEQEAALAGGEGAIRRLILRKRQAAQREDQHKLTLLEASLLARDQLRPGQRVDPEVSALVRRFSYYL